MPKKFGVNTK